MTTTILKTELTKAINGINDKSLLEALYTIINQTKKSSQEYEMTEDDWTEIESRKKELKSGIVKTVTMDQIRNRVAKKRI